MSRHHPLRGHPRPDAQHINARIRRLMSEPADLARSVEYTQFLTLWAEETQTGVDQAA